MKTTIVDVMQTVLQRKSASQRKKARTSICIYISVSELFIFS